MGTYYPQNGSGWMCAMCGSWIPSGMEHVCPNVIPQGCYQIVPDWQHIEKMLERILFLCEQWHLREGKHA